MIHYFDRSRLETSYKCPRREYWEYYYDGKGLQPVRLNQHLAFGSAVHEGIASILNYCRVYDTIPDIGVIALYIKAANSGLRYHFIDGQGFQAPATTEMTFDGEMIQVTEDQTWLIDHYCDLLEGLVIGWCLVRLPQLMQQYRVLEVETEERMVLAQLPALCVDGVCPHYGVPHIHELVTNKIVFLSRPDAILERRTDAALVIHSLKTVSQVNQMWLENFKTDQQTISEVLPVESRLGREVAGVQIEGLTKGAQAVEWPRGSGHKHHASPLIWGYLKEEGGLAEDWQAKWEWTDEAGNNRRLGKGFNRQRISERYPGGISEWVGYLYQREHELLRAQFPSPPLISRSAHELDEWQEQVKYRETEVHNGLVKLATGEGVEQVLAQVFPKHTIGCAYDPQFHSKCPCFELCWGSEGTDPLGSGRYKYRESNHPEVEVEA